MRAQARAELAHLAYLRALAAERLDPTPARWARLLSTARNLRDAIRDRRLEAFPDRPGGRGRAQASRALDRPTAAGRLIAFPRAHRFDRWPELAWEFRRADELMRQARALLAKTRANREALSSLRGRLDRPSP
jgi:hypothetical protein